MDRALRNDLLGKQQIAMRWGFGLLLLALVMLVNPDGAPLGRFLLIPVLGLASVIYHVQWIFAVERKGLDVFLGKRLAGAPGGVEFCLGMVLCGLLVYLAFVAITAVVDIVAWERSVPYILTKAMLVGVLGWSLARHIKKKRGLRNALQGLGLRTLYEPPEPVDEGPSMESRTVAFIEDVNSGAGRWAFGCLVVGCGALLLPFEFLAPLRPVGFALLGLCCGFGVAVANGRRILQGEVSASAAKRKDPVPWWKLEERDEEKEALPISIFYFVLVLFNFLLYLGFYVLLQPEREGSVALAVIAVVLGGVVLYSLAGVIRELGNWRTREAERRRIDAEQAGAQRDQ